MNPWKTAYVFVSSTFRDMHAERDYLSRIIFPELKLTAALYNIHIEEIDLRDGLTEWKVAGNEAIMLCKEMIDKCRPFFICLLGDRYGWIPPDLEKSITHLEIEYASIETIQKKKLLFLFRDPLVYNSIPEEVRLNKYMEQDPNLKEKQIFLKNLIRKYEFPIFDGYPSKWDDKKFSWESNSKGNLTGLDEFGGYIKSKIWTNIKKEFSLPDKPNLNSDYINRDIKSNFMTINESTKSFVGRKEILHTIDESLKSNSILLISGEVGLGKTTILSMIAKEIGARPNSIVISNFPSATAYSKNIKYILWKLCRCVEKSLGFKVINTIETENLLESFHSCISHFQQDKELIFIIDGIDEYEDEGSFFPNCLLPHKLPNNVKMIFSCCGEVVKEYAWWPDFNRKGILHLSIPQLNVNDGKKIIDEQVPLYPQHLIGAENEEKLLMLNSSRNSLCIKLSFNYIFRAHNLNDIKNRIEALSVSNTDANINIEGLVNVILDNMEHEFGREIISDLFRILSAGRSNFNELELNEIIEVFHPQADLLLPVLFEMRKYLPRKWGKNRTSAQ